MANKVTTPLGATNNATETVASDPYPQVIKTLREQEQMLLSSIIQLENENVDEHQLADLRRNLRETRKKREILEDPDNYRDRLDRRALDLIQQSKLSTTTPEQAKQMRDEAATLFNVSRKILEYTSTIPTIDSASMKQIQDINKELGGLAQKREDLVKNINKMIDQASTLLIIIAKLLPLAALAI